MPFQSLMSLQFLFLPTEQLFMECHRSCYVIMAKIDSKTAQWNGFNENYCICTIQQDHLIQYYSNWLTLSQYSAWNILGNGWVPNQFCYGIQFCRHRFIQVVNTARQFASSNIVLTMVSCQKGPTHHAYAWRIGPFWQDTLDKQEWNVRFFSWDNLTHCDPVMPYEDMDLCQLWPK